MAHLSKRRRILTKNRRTKGVVYALVAMCSFPSATRALSIDNVGGSIGLSPANFSTLLVNLVNWILGLLGIIAVAMIILGGFQWLISGGNDESVATAKKTIGNAVIGIIVILLAWAVVHFTIGTIENASGV